MRISKVFERLARLGPEAAANFAVFAIPLLKMTELIHQLRH
jgi:hypothetical protein